MISRLMDVNTQVINTSLEALLERATNKQNESTDIAAVNSFAALVSKEPNSASNALQLMVPKLQSVNEWEALQAFWLLETCMESAGSNFQSEVGKFRFLNELIKLISPKHSKLLTPYKVRCKVIDLLYSWTSRYSKETKIKDAYDMLKKQGFVSERDPSMPVTSISSSKQPFESKVSITRDEEKVKLLQKLLSSKKQHDLQAANLLIQSMVKDEEKKEVIDELKRSSDINVIKNNMLLLSEMLSTYSSNKRFNHEEAEVITDLYNTCVRMRPILTDMIINHEKSSRFYEELLSLNDCLNDTLAQYEEIFYNCERSSSESHNDSPTLLDLNSPEHVQCDTSNQTQVQTNAPNDVDSSRSNINSLEDIFSSMLTPSVCLTSNEDEDIPTVKKDDLTMKNEIYKSCKLFFNDGQKATPNSLFGDLDTLGKLMVHPSVTTTKTSSSQKLSLNELAESNFDASSNLPKIESSSGNQTALNTDDDQLLCDLLGDNGSSVKEMITPVNDGNNDLLSADYLSSDKKVTVATQPIGDISVPLIKIIPGNNKKLLALDDNDGLTTEIQLMENKPRNDISVYLVFTTSKKLQSVHDFLFQPVVPKDCRLKLQAPSKTELPPYNPYIPNETIVQIMLISSINKNDIPLHFLVSYKIDEETFTEMGKIDSLPLMLN